jgi:tetratricopeptide (TPR) repeat protein
MLRTLSRLFARRGDPAGKPATPSQPVVVADPVQCPADKAERVDALLQAPNGAARAMQLATALVAEYPDCGLARCLLGEAARRAGQAEQALEHFEHVLEQHPQYVVALLGQGRAFRDLGRPEDAADSFEIVLALGTRNAQAHAELGALYQQAGALEQALEHLEAAVASEAVDAETWERLAQVRQALGAADSAREAYGKALALDPQSISARINLGVLLLDHYGDPCAAEKLFREALRLAPTELAATCNLGLALQEQGRFEEALKVYRNVPAHARQFPELRWNRALNHLQQGRFATAWPDYEARFERDGGRAKRAFPFAQWTGKLPTEGALLVYAEQGLGDEIMFASCVPDLVRSGSNVVLECNLRLESLFRRSFPGVRVRGAARDGKREWLAAYPDIRWQVPIGSLPRYLRTSREAFPPVTRYLCADARAVSAWKQRLAQSAARLSVGLAWRGGTVKTRTTLRSMDLAALKPLLGVSGVRFVCLQHDVRPEEAQMLGQAGVIVPDMQDLDQTAALLEALDLTISVPSSLAHLAGGLDRPLWIALNANPEWRWQWSGERTPWYSSARLFRQERMHDWAGVVARLVSELQVTTDSTRSAVAQG